MKYTTMTTNNTPRPNGNSVPLINNQQSIITSPHPSAQSNGRALNWLCFGPNWLCIGFELALFFLASQLPVLTYQFIKKALTAIFQMLRLALFSKTKPISQKYVFMGIYFSLVRIFFRCLPAGKGGLEVNNDCFIWIIDMADMKRVAIIANNGENLNGRGAL
jgi:hypothetical protein